jgi:hypothetical protein
MAGDSLAGYGTTRLTARYVLQLAPKGDILVFFTDERGNHLRRGNEVSSPIARGTGTATLSSEFVIPRDVFALWLRVAVIPVGLKEYPAGVLGLRYPVVRQAQKE